ncbi:MAG: DNA-binding protein [Armatimonadetes bacterium]|nr:MAG: DNA-binding protein [Armatimonadota bacterium]
MDATKHRAPGRLVDIEEVAAELNLSSRTIRRLVADGEMPEPVRIGGSLRWDRVVLGRWIEAGCPTQNERDTGGGQ